MDINKYLKIRDTKGKREGPNDNVFGFYNVEDNGSEGIILELDNECAEVYIDKELGYGEYECDVELPILLPKEVIFGFFLYKDDNNECDIEFSRWNKIFNKNCQVIIQGNKPIKFWNLKKKNHLKILWAKSYIKFSINKQNFEFETDKNNDFGILHINLWKICPTSKCNVKIKNLKFTEWIE